MTARRIPLRETLEVEFKRDRDSLSDDQLIEANLKELGYGE